MITVNRSGVNPLRLHTRKVARFGAGLTTWCGNYNGKLAHTAADEQWLADQHGKREEERREATRRLDERAQESLWQRAYERGYLPL